MTISLLVLVLAVALLNAIQDEPRRRKGRPVVIIVVALVAGYGIATGDVVVLAGCATALLGRGRGPRLFFGSAVSWAPAVS